MEQVKELMERWNGLRQKLKQERFKFDATFREKNLNHNCDSKVYSWNGEWFCRHLTEARYHKYKRQINEEDGIIMELVKSSYGQ